jgi:hypothetical protein
MIEFLPELYMHIMAMTNFPDFVEIFEHGLERGANQVVAIGLEIATDSIRKDSGVIAHLKEGLSVELLARILEDGRFDDKIKSLILLSNLNVDSPWLIMGILSDPPETMEELRPVLRLLS